MKSVNSSYVQNAIENMSLTSHSEQSQMCGNLSPADVSMSEEFKMRSLAKDRKPGKSTFCGLAK